MPVDEAASAGKNSIFQARGVTKIYDMGEVQVQALRGVDFDLEVEMRELCLRLDEASGNGGAVGGPADWEQFTQWRWTTVKPTPPAYPF